jgi:hypothetical protein
MVRMIMMKSGAIGMDRISEAWSFPPIAVEATP